MSGDDWQPGDLALVVKRGAGANRGRPAPGQNRPVVGGVYTVEGIYRHPNGVLGLVIVDHHSDHSSRAWAAHCFRKIRPHVPDAEDAETIRLLNGKPAHTPA